MLLMTKYIDDQGFLKNIFFKISHNINNAEQLKIFKLTILSQYNSNVLILRGISDFGKLVTSASRLITDQYDIDINSNNFNILTLPEPAFGSAVECITTNLTLQTQIECQKVQSYFESIRIKLVPIDTKADALVVLLNEIRSNGIHTHKYELKFEFSEDWSPTCNTCQTGMQYLQQELAKLSEELYCAKDMFNLDGRIITDLSVNNISVLKDEIKLLLTNALLNARVRDFTITDVSDTIGEFGDET